MAAGVSGCGGHCSPGRGQLRRNFPVRHWRVLNKLYLNSKLIFHAPSPFLGSLPRKEEERSRYLLASGYMRQERHGVLLPSSHPLEKQEPVWVV